MASESTDEGVVSVELPPGLDEWLDERARELGEPREELVRQLLAAYRATTTELDEGDLGTVLDVEDRVEDAMAARVDAAVEEAVAGRVDETVRERLPDITDAVESRIDGRLEEIEGEFQTKLTDVRERVVQLKRELDGKAPADHEAFDAVADLEERLTELNRELVAVRDDVAADVDDQSARTDELERELDTVRETMDEVDERLDDTESKLKRVAWVVNDLRDDQGGRDAHQRAVDRIKRAAAQEGITSASCQDCGETVEIALLTEPQCPHCNTTVSDVRPEGGIIRTKASLVTAAQLEAGPADE